MIYHSFFHIKNDTATIIGTSKLAGTDVVATDLRAGAAMVAAALLAEGKTTITNILSDLLH